MMRSTSKRLTSGRVPSYRHLLAAPDLRALLLATLLARLAGVMFALAIVLYALSRTGSAVLAGWLAFAALKPGLAVSPLAGALIDRVGSVWAITVDMAAGAACTTALSAADAAGWASPPVLLALTGLYSLTRPLSMAGIRALLPRLVAPGALDRANALDTAIHGVTDIVGPATAGAIVAFGGAAWALLAIAAIQAAAALSIGTVHQPRGRLPRFGPLLWQGWTGLLRVVTQPTLRGLAVSYSLYQVTWGILIVVVPVFATRTLVGGASAMLAGTLWAGLGLVGAVAALVAGHWRTAGRERKVMTLGLLATSLAAWPLAGEFGLPGLVVALLLFGAAEGWIDVSALTLRQRRTDPAELGRVLSVSMSLNMSGAPLGSALAGVLVGWSLPGTFAVAALAAAFAAAAVALIPGDQACGNGHHAESAGMPTLPPSGS
jgi:MFS family permease